MALNLPDLGWLENLDQPRLVYDLLRVLISFFAAILWLTSLRLALVRWRRDGLRSGAAGSSAVMLLSYSVMALIVVVTQLGLLGRPLTWRVPLLLVAVALGLVAMHDQVRFSRPAQRHKDRDG